MLVLILVLGLGGLMLICVIGLLVVLLCGNNDSEEPCSERGGGFSAIAQNPEFMAAIGKSFANQTATLSRMVEEEKDDVELVFECSSCHFVMTEENISYSDNTCPHCGSTMYR